MHPSAVLDFNGKLQWSHSHLALSKRRPGTATKVRMKRSDMEWQTSKSTFHNFPQVCTDSQVRWNLKILRAEKSQVGPLESSFYSRSSSPLLWSHHQINAPPWRRERFPLGSSKPPGVCGSDVTVVMDSWLHFFTLVKQSWVPILWWFSWLYLKFLLGWFCFFMPHFPWYIWIHRGRVSSNHPIIVCFGVCSGVFVLHRNISFLFAAKTSPRTPSTVKSIYGRMRAE